MKRLVALFVIVGCLAGASLVGAQTSALPEDTFQPDWERRPTGQMFAANYPPQALDRGIGGVAHLCCTPREDRTLDCRVGVSWPREYAFGDASLAVARGFRMTPESYARFQATPGAWMQVPIRWRVNGMSPEIDEVVDQIGERARGLCRPAAPAPEPAPGQ